jgi:hypothetical protein
MVKARVEFRVRMVKVRFRVGMFQVRVGMVPVRLPIMYNVFDSR